MQQKKQVPAKPFLKWAGGKRQLIQTLSKNLPVKFERYFEPFIGGGALFFYVLVARHCKEYKISDLNQELIDAYITVRDQFDELIVSLQDHDKKYYCDDPQKYYYQVRAMLPTDNVKKTSRMIFLNRTCFNGLYRVNSKGLFNVPFGKYPHQDIVKKDNLQLVNHFLAKKPVSIVCNDFESILNDAKSGDFIYFDPPYEPISTTAKFTRYTKKDFLNGGIERLADLCNKLDSKGCQVMLSNSNSEKVRDLFSSKPWMIKTISASRMINSDAKKRAGHFELLIKNYGMPPQIQTTVTTKDLLKV